MHLIDERNKRTVQRKIAKKEYDSIITLSVNERVQTVRLLDEGAVVMANGQIDFYIKKGTLEKYMADLPDDYEGTINLGHMDFATFPLLLGTWKKSDLHLVDIGDGRKGLDVDLRLDYDNVLVRELARAPYTLGVSAEFAYHLDSDATQKLGVEVIDDIFIKDFAIVGEAGNVGSSEINLTMKGETTVTLKELNEKLGVTEEAPEVTLDVTEEVTEEVAEEVAEEVTEVSEEEPAEGEDEPEAVEDEAVADDETDKMLSVMADVIEKLNAKVEALTAKIAQLSAEKAEAEKELAVKAEKERQRLEKFASLYPSLAEEKTEPVENKEVLRTDGIGEW